jgi:Fe-S-cluster containining protein
MDNKELCIKCGHACCKWMGMTYGELNGRALEFYIARGCKILRCDIDKEQSIYRIYLPYFCPHLIEGEGCDIYERRPLACIEYEWKLDPIVKDICLIEE